VDHWDDGRDRGDPGERRDAVKQGLVARLVGVIELESGGLGGVRRAGSPESLSSSGLQSATIPSGDQESFAAEAAVGQATAGWVGANEVIAEAAALAGWVTSKSSAPARGRRCGGLCCQVSRDRATTGIRAGR
jgi:hypothetical protein